MKTADESKEVRKKVADIINENPDKASNYDWAVISGRFDKDCIFDVMKFIKDDSVCAIIENHIIKAFRTAIRRQEYHRGKTQTRLIHDLESIRQMRALFVDVKDYDNKKKASDPVDEDKAKEEVEKTLAENKILKAENKQLKQDNHLLKEENEKLKVQTPKSGEQEWIGCFDGFLHKNLNPSKIAEALKNINHQNFPKNERGYWWVFVTVLTEINWIPKQNHKLSLQWANLHFNCGWDWMKENQFRFTDINEIIRSTPTTEWNKQTTGNVIGNYYGALAETMKNTFIDVVEGGKLIDKRTFLKPDAPYINNGKK